MKKVVINDCYGGFSLSDKACQRYLELIGKKAFYFKSDFSGSNYEPLEDGEKTFYSTIFTVNNPNEILKEFGSWHSMSLAEKKKYNKVYESISFSSRELERDDPILVQVVKELGSDANGRCAELKIVKIPDDVEYTIEEYDGNEHVAEKHRTWG